MKRRRKCDCCRRGEATKKIFYGRNGKKKELYCDDCYKYMRRYLSRRII